jgi:hypothetical protein
MKVRSLVLLPMYRTGDAIFAYSDLNQSRSISTSSKEGTTSRVATEQTSFECSSVGVQAPYRLPKRPFVLAVSLLY